MVLGPLLTANLKGMAKCLRYDWDWVHLVEGEERSGKSCLGIQICELVQSELGTPLKQEQITQSVPDMKYQAYELPKYSALQADEGASMFFGRDAMKPENKEAIKFLTIMGESNLFLVICVTTLEVIDPYIRKHRIKSLTVVTKRGRLKFYSRKRVKQIRYDPRLKRWIYPSANFAESYTLPENTEFWEAYKKRKREYNRDKMIERKDPNLLGITKAAIAVDRKPSTIYAWEKKGLIEPIKVAGRKKYRLDQLNKLVGETD